MSTLDKCTDPENWACNSLKSNWNKLNCKQEMRYARLLGSNPDSIKYSKKFLSPYVDKWESFVKEYFKRYDLTDDVQSGRYCSLQEQIMDVCINSYTSPLCSEYLNKACRKFSRSRVSQSRSLSEMCGCRVTPDPTYLKYTKKPSCDPMCNRVGVAHVVDMDTGLEDRCTRNICVISDVSLKLYKTKVKGGVVLNQICGHCGKEGCTCIISGVSLTTVLQDLNLPVVYEQFCSGNSVCLQTNNTDGMTKVTDCKGALKEARAKAHARKLGSLVYYLVFLGVALVVITVVIVAFNRTNRVH